MLLLWLLTPCHGQSSQDTVCYSQTEARAITIALIEWEACMEEMAVCDEQLLELKKAIAGKDSAITDMMKISQFKSEVIDLRVRDMEVLKSEVKRFKRRSAVTIILASIVTGFTLFIAVK